ncbi:MAG: hypothetical protein Aurels2KO_22440 [Aureliella sp.]
MSLPSEEYDAAEFAFGGEVAKLLQQWLVSDMQGAKLDWKFRLYYGLRPLVPPFARQLLQRSRNRNLTISDDWYLSKDFVAQFLEVVGEEVRQDDPVVLHPWPKDYSHSVVLTHDVETKQGFARIDRLAQLEEEAGLRSTWFIIPNKYRVDHGLLRDLRDRGHEVGIHGYNHDGRLFTSRGLFHARALRINTAMQRFPAKGFRTPMVHRQLNWMQELDAAYDASCFDTDPFQAMPGGVGGVWPFRYGKFVELPYTLPQDHTLLRLGNFSPKVWLQKYDLVRRLRGMAMLITHPDYLETNDHLDVYRAFLKEISEDTRAWHCLAEDVLGWWQQREHFLADEDLDCDVRRQPLSELFIELLDAPELTSASRTDA